MKFLKECALFGAVCFSGGYGLIFCCTRLADLLDAILA